MSETTCKVPITYFKPSGKYYTDDFVTLEESDNYHLYDFVQNLNNSRSLPGLQSGTWEGYILIEDKNEVPHLIQVARKKS